MAHKQQKNFFESVKTQHPNHFKDCVVLDIGSLDINGNNTYLFNNCTYIGVDIGEGKNVDIVGIFHEIDFYEQFDTVISAECFEHDKYYKKDIRKAVELTKSGGLFTFSCATTGRKEHGTRRTTPEDSPFTVMDADWCDYYKNLTISDIREIINLDNEFSDYDFQIDLEHKDLYFWGIKR
jgi:hypothetical protein